MADYEALKQAVIEGNTARVKELTQAAIDSGDDPQGVLEGGGNALRHIKVRRAEDMNPDVIVPLLRQAILLNAK